MPNFIRFGKDWFKVFNTFLKVLGYKYIGLHWVKSKDRPHGIRLKDSPNIDGYVIASVPSKTFENSGHSVVMNLKGIVVHDPNKSKWKGINVVRTKQLQHWMMIEKEKLNE